MLTQEILKKHLHYDCDTGIFKWIKSDNVAGTENRGYILIRINNNRYFAHRLAWLYVYGTFPKNDIDHINGIRNDNRLINLRDVTRSVNLQNLKKCYSNNKSGLLGVSWNKKANKWQASIGLNGKLIYIGMFNDKYDAHKEYLNKKHLIHLGGA